MSNRARQRETGPSGIDVAGMTSAPQVRQNQNGVELQEQNSGVTFDLSSFDPLQAHTLQLTASAGLINMLNPPSAAGARSPANRAAENPGSQSKLHEESDKLPQQTARKPPQEPLQQDHPQHCQNPYYFVQNTSSGDSNGATKTPPSAQQRSIGQRAVSIPAAAPQPQNYLLTRSHSNNLAAQTGFGHSVLFTGALHTAASPNFAQGQLVMTQHYKNVAGGSALQNPPGEIATESSKRRNVEVDDSVYSKFPPNKRREMAPPVLSSNVPTTGALECGNPIYGDVMALPHVSTEATTKEDEHDVESMTPAERRRHERNLREQQRSYRISQQIKELREVLTESNVPFKPNKYSILLSVVDYIKQLQSRAIMLDAEHQKLIATIRQTNELINSGSAPYSGTDETEETNTSENTCGSFSVGEADMLFVQGLDYRSLFEQCPAALGIAALDGRILECNAEFQILLGFAREELLKQSLFNLVRNHQDIFRAMAKMLKSAEESMGAGESIASSPSPTNSRHWSGPVISKRNRELSLNITLTVADDGSPKFFSCALTMM